MEPTQKDRIIEEAMRMFVQQGIKSVRMDDIARSLGVSKRTLYEQFGDKEELLALSITRFFEQRRERTVAAAAHAADVLEGLFIALNHILDSTVVSTRMMDNLKKFYPAVHDRVMAEGREKNYRDFRRMLEIGVEEGLFVSDFNFDLAISMLYYTASGLMNHRLEIVPSGMSERDAFVQIVGNFFRGISTRKGLELVDEYKRRYTPPRPETTQEN
ncbi:TetR/AcrR family transcriptional regulator [uncultured Alistipes sp.]|uniref:TetR/AcrR family transcriptional regulator n=1 Tax=uncultured Alistipes sp. TaxID=538949 RepID=UPI0025DE870D|nr:TetR/AcrR family transcriptional regulator [uncultured Alistipes sp.]